MNEQIEVQEIPLKKASMANDKLFVTHALESPMRTTIIPQADNK